MCKNRVKKLSNYSKKIRPILVCMRKKTFITSTSINDLWPLPLKIWVLTPNFKLFVLIPLSTQIIWRTKKPVRMFKISTPKNECLSTLMKPSKTTMLLSSKTKNSSKSTWSCIQMILYKTRDKVCTATLGSLIPNFRA
jgi:hypothetical protein